MENNDTRIVWITMLAMADKNGEVQASVPGLARVAGVQTESCREALAKFLSPDPDSRTKDDDGKRIEPIEGGWRLLNHRKYREMCSREEQKASEAKRKADYRAKIKRNGGICDEMSENVPDMSQPVTDMSRDVPKSLHIAKEKADSKADSYSEEDEYKNKENMSADADVSDFFAEFETHPKKKRSAGNYPPEVIELWSMFPPMSCTRSCKADFYTQYRKAANKPPHADLVRSVAAWARCNEWTKNNGEYAPGAHLFFKNRKWESEPVMFSPTRQKGTIENIQLKILNGPHKNV